MADPEVLDLEMQRAIEDFQSADIKQVVSAIQQCGLIVYQIPYDLEGCSDMQEDIEGIQQWATVFSQPVTLSQTIVSNVYQYWGEVKVSIEQQTSKWEEEKYFEWGQDVAGLLERSLGSLAPKTHGQTDF